MLPSISRFGFNEILSITTINLQFSFVFCQAYGNRKYLWLNFAYFEDRFLLNIYDNPLNYSVSDDILLFLNLKMIFKVNQHVKTLKFYFQVKVLLIRYFT